MRASDEGHDKCVKLLLEKGATLNLQSTVSLLVNNFVMFNSVKKVQWKWIV